MIILTTQWREMMSSNFFLGKGTSDLKADYLLLYEQNWLKEGTEALVLKKTAVSSK